MPAITFPDLRLPAGLIILKDRNGGPWMIRRIKPKDGAQSK